MYSADEYGEEFDRTDKTRNTQGSRYAWLKPKALVLSHPHHATTLPHRALLLSTFIYRLFTLVIFSALNCNTTYCCT